MRKRKVFLEDDFAAFWWEPVPPLRYTVVWAFAGTALAVAELTYSEAWEACDLHSKAGHTSWVEAEA